MSNNNNTSHNTKVKNFSKKKIELIIYDFRQLQRSQTYMIDTRESSFFLILVLSI